MLTAVRTNREHPLEELYLVDIERVKIDTSIKKAHCSTKPTYVHMIDNTIEGTILKKTDATNNREHEFDDGNQ